jgi:hypothetical protein
VLPRRVLQVPGIHGAMNHRMHRGFPLTLTLRSLKSRNNVHAHIIMIFEVVSEGIFGRVEERGQG